MGAKKSNVVNDFTAPVTSRLNVLRSSAVLVTEKPVWSTRSNEKKSLASKSMLPTTLAGFEPTLTLNVVPPSVVSASSTSVYPVEGLAGVAPTKSKEEG